MFNYFDLSNTDDFQYMLDMMGKDVLVNGNLVRALVTNTDLNRNYDDKKISTLTEIKRGDLIEYDGKKWLIISEVNGKRYNKYKGIMRRCNYDVTFKTGETQTIVGYDPMGRPIYATVEEHQTFPTIIDSKTFDIQTGQVINMAEGKILVTLQENPESLKIALDTRFIKMGNAWKIVGKDRTKKGLIVLTAEIGLFSQYDDLENEIAYNSDPNAGSGGSGGGDDLW
ncbi:hypothetical protein BSNK01_00080 [Bacillaceae bacterium]